jgi:LruC domain-containing protein
VRTWAFVPGGYPGNYDAQGVPNTMQAPTVELTDAFWNRLAAALPETRDVRLTNPDYVDASAPTNLRLQSQAEVFLTFLHEGAAARHSVGYVAFNPASPPQTQQQAGGVIAFPNTSYDASGGSTAGLRAGQTVRLGFFPAGTAIGFVLAIDGFDQQVGVSTSLANDRVLYSLPGLNVASDPSLARQNLLLYDADRQAFVLGFEATPRSSGSSDSDFNDALFMVTTSPGGGFDTAGMPALPLATDSDGDGALDGNDDYPTDATRAFLLHYPGGNGEATLAFEDKWPYRGDYDMNDLVLQYSFDQVVDAQGRVKDVTAAFHVTARGAIFVNGFGLHIPGVNPSTVESAARRIDAGAWTPHLPEAGQQFLTFIVFDNAASASRVPPGCTFFNTEHGCPRGTGGSAAVRFTFATAQPPALIGNPPYNPFIFRVGNRGLEVHLPDRPPTTLADASLLGSADDTSDPTRGRYYKTAGNLPFALDMPTRWRYPLERTTILQGYRSFGPWAESAGQTRTDWYVADIDTDFLY